MKRAVLTICGETTGVPFVLYTEKYAIRDVKWNYCSKAFQVTWTKVISVIIKYVKVHHLYHSRCIVIVIYCMYQIKYNILYYTEIHCHCQRNVVDQAVNKIIYNGLAINGKQSSI